MIIRSRKRVIEIFLKSKKSCRYYWKACIALESNGKYRVQFFDKFGEPYEPKLKSGEETRESPLFDDLDDAKMYVRKTLLNQ